MRIIQLNRDDFGGGAWRAALRLNDALQARGMDSRMLVGMQRNRDAAVEALVFPGRVAERMRRVLRRWMRDMTRRRSRRANKGRYEGFDDDRSQYGSSLVEAVPPCGVLNLHLVTRLLDYAGFFPAMTERNGVVWTLHDMNPFTGGCHYDDACGRWRRGCGCCPQLASRSPHDLSARAWQRKRRSLDAVQVGRLCIVTPSRWLAREVAESPLLGRFRVEVIPNSVDADVYKPRDRALCREVLGVPPDARVVLFVAQQIANRRKGYASLLDALGKLAHVPRLMLLTVGIDVPSIEPPVPVRHLGDISMEGLLTLVYGAANVLAAPSLQDNLPNTVMESIACGTPVAGFDVGGMRDMVRDGETGCLASARDSGAMARALERILTDECMAHEMGAHCRRVAEQEYSSHRQAERYAELYRGLVR